MSKNSNNVVSYGGFDFIVNRSRGRRIRLKVDGSNAGVYLYLPYGVPISAAFPFINEKAEWLKKTLYKVKNREKEYALNLNSVFFKGEKLPVVYSKNGDSCVIKGVLYINCDSSATDVVKLKARDKFLKNTLEEFISVRVEYYEKLTGLKSSGFTVRKMKSRWGTCRTDTGKLTFNFAMAYMSEYCADYVILHEIAHLKHADHGAGFKSFLTYYMPDWKLRKNNIRGKYKCELNLS